MERLFIFFGVPQRRVPYLPVANPLPTEQRRGAQIHARLPVSEHDHECSRLNARRISQGANFPGIDVEDRRRG